MSEPREMLAYIPYRLGFQPAWSVVLLSLQPAGRGRSRIGLVVRVDLGDLADPTHGLALARSLSTHLRADGAGGVLTVVYADLPLDEVTRHEPWQRASEHLGAALGWVRGRQVWAVTRTRYAHLGCAEPTCCPSGGRPVTELEGTRVGAEMVLQGASVVPGREALAVRPARSGPARGAALRGARRERARLAQAGSGPAGSAFGLAEHHGAPEELRAWRVEGAELWDALRATLARHGTPPPGQLGRMAVFLGDRVLRDAAVAGAMARAGSTAEHLDPAAVAHAYDASPPPDRRVLGPAVQLLTEVAAHAPRGSAAPALGALAFLSWWQGDGARADVLAEQCLAEDPAHRLGLLVREALVNGVPPGWVREAP